MILFGRDVLLVGETFPVAHELTDKLRRWMFRCRFARNLRSASDLLRSQPVDLVLSNTHLTDGTGLRLLRTLAGLPVTAFLCLPVEKSCLWLPAIDAGKACLGLPALRPSEFAAILEAMALQLSAPPSLD